MIVLSNSMSDETIVELLNNGINDNVSRSEIVPRGVKARKVFWNGELGRWYGVDSGVYRAGEKVRHDRDQLLVGNLPKRCFVKNRGYSFLRPELSERLEPLLRERSSVMLLPEKTREFISNGDIVPDITEDAHDSYEEISNREDDLIEKRREREKEIMSKRLSMYDDEDDFYEED